MSFKVGQKVVFLHEKGSGVIRSINTIGRFLIEDEEGFSRLYIASEIAAIYGEDYRINEDDIVLAKEEAINIKLSSIVQKEPQSGRHKSEGTWEIDLHSHNVMDSEQGMTSSEILQKQLATFRIFFGQARKKSIRRIIVIHGVGEGVLKNEVRSFLDKTDGASYYDSDFREYGKGATTIEINHDY